MGLFSCFVFLAFVLSGCCTLVCESCTLLESKPNTEVLLQANITVSENSNPDSDGRPSPIMIRIYQLKSASRFENADFPSLYDNDEMVLGSDLLFKEEMDAHPGIKIPFERKLQGTARYLGIMVAFRDFEHATWRELIDLPAEGEFPLLVEIDNLSVSARQP